MKFLKKIFIQYVPGPLQQAFRRFFIWPLISIIRFIVSDIWLPVYRLEQSGLTVILIGHQAYDPYLIYLLYAEYITPWRIGTVPIWGFSRVMRRWENMADFIVFRDRKFRPREALARPMLSIPYWVSQSVDLPPSDADLLVTFHKPSTKSDLKRIRDAKFQYEITQDPAQLDFFYHEMYQPTAKKRYRESAEIYPWEAFRQYYEKMELLLIYKAGAPVAGSLNLQTGDCYALHLGGVLNGDWELLHAGSDAACYWFSMVEAHRRGCVTVNMLCARPFLKNGVLAYKKKWGGKIITDYREREFWLQPCGNRPVMRRFLEENPFICEQDGQLVSLIFLGSHTILNDSELSSYLKQCLYHGDLMSTCIVLLDSEWAARAETIQNILRELPQPNHILDLSNGSLAELRDLISKRQDLLHSYPAEFPQLAYSR